MRTLKEARQQAGITQKELGDLIGRSTQTVRDYEAGNYNIPNDIKNDIKGLVGEFEVKTKAQIRMPKLYQSGKNEADRTLKDARLEAGLSQRELAFKSGLNVRSIINYETGIHGMSEIAREKIENVIGKFKSAY